MTTPAELLKQGIDAAYAGRRREARYLFMQVVELEPRNEMAWMWLTGLMDDLEDQIIACENVLTINPSNGNVRAFLETLLRQKEALARDEQKESKPGLETPTISVREETKPADLKLLAEQLEQEGKIEEAIKAYEYLASKTRDSQAFDHVYKQITRLEGLKKENIRHVNPATSVLRLSFTWPIVYLSFVFIQVGLNPIRNLSLLWFGLPLVALGSFLLALSEVRIKHVIWQKIFLEDGHGSGFARIVLAIFGWVLVLLPFAFILLGSLARLRYFQIPPPIFG